MFLPVPVSLLAAAEDPIGHPLWWILAAGALAFGRDAVGLLSTVAKTRASAVESVIERCNRLEAKVALLEAKDQEQQSLIDKLERQRDDLASSLAGALQSIATLNQQVTQEKDLKHACRRQMQAAVVVIDVYRDEYGQHANDHFDCEVWRDHDKSARKSSKTPLTMIIRRDAPPAV